MSLMIISMFIEEKRLRLAFYLIVALATLCFINLYLTFTYYIKLRNEPGIPGPQGPKGDKGPKGDAGDEGGVSDKPLTVSCLSPAIGSIHGLSPPHFIL